MYTGNARILVTYIYRNISASTVIPEQTIEQDQGCLANKETNKKPNIDRLSNSSNH